jgi:hypothetical protein
MKALLNNSHAIKIIHSHIVQLTIPNSISPIYGSISKPCSILMLVTPRHLLTSNEHSKQFDSGAPHEAYDQND